MPTSRTLRMFTAVIPPSEVLAELSDRLDMLRPLAPAARWTDPDAWHVTTSFMGTVFPRLVDELIGALETATASLTPFDVTLRAGGAFPNPASARQLWVGLLDPDARLARLAGAARGAAMQVGVPVDRKKFTAHLTLARFRAPHDCDQLIAQMSDFQSSPWRVDQLYLFESQLGKGSGGRPRHQVIQRFNLGVPEKPGAPG